MSFIFNCHTKLSTAIKIILFFILKSRRKRNTKHCKYTFCWTQRKHLSRALHLLHNVCIGLFFHLRFRHSCGTEAEVDPHAAAHASWCQPGVQQQRAFTASGELLSFHPHGHCLPAYFHPAGRLFPHRYPQAGRPNLLAHSNVSFLLVCCGAPLIWFLICLQLQLLLQYLKDDPRKAVKRLAVNDLKLLAKKAPHLWIRENTQVEPQMATVAL